MFDVVRFLRFKPDHVFVETILQLADGLGRGGNFLELRVQAGLQFIQLLLRANQDFPFHFGFAKPIGRIPGCGISTRDRHRRNNPAWANWAPANFDGFKTTTVVPKYRRQPSGRRTSGIEECESWFVKLFVHGGLQQAGRCRWLHGHFIEMFFVRRGKTSCS